MLLSRLRNSSAMGVALACLTGLATFVYAATSVRSADGLETLVFIRHGEKLAAGLGQLDCAGLNRALALPLVLRRLFGTPVAIFAPNPAKKKQDGGLLYNYVRPLATIEPTAIKLKMAVNTDYGFDETPALEAALTNLDYHNATVFISWEHNLIQTVAQDLLRAHGADHVVETWPSEDFDSIYVVTLSWTGTTAKAAFTRQTEGLNGQPSSCPGT